jgi:hypothetical protein
MKTLLVVFLLSAAALAQRPTPFGQRGATPAPVPPAATPDRVPTWRCELPGGIYQVAIRAIISISSHEYVVDAVARVTEVNVDTNGSLTVRFYYLEPVVPAAAGGGVSQSALDRIQELSKEAGARTGLEAVWQKVTKNYPTTTHAKTIEYRLDSKDQVLQIFASADKAFRTGLSTTIKLP